MEYSPDQICSFPDFITLHRLWELTSLLRGLLFLALPLPLYLRKERPQQLLLGMKPFRPLLLRMDTARL